MLEKLRLQLYCGIYGYGIGVYAAYFRPVDDQMYIA